MRFSINQLHHDKVRFPSCLSAPTVPRESRGARDRHSQPDSVFLDEFVRQRELTRIRFQGSRKTSGRVKVVFYIQMGSGDFADNGCYHSVERMSSATSFACWLTSGVERPFAGGSEPKSIPKVASIRYRTRAISW